MAKLTSACEADVGSRQRRCVVDPVADHRHHSLAGLQRIDRCRFVRGQDAGLEIIDTGLLGNRRGGSRMVTGQHHDADSHAMEASHGGTRGLAQRVGDGQER